MGKKNGAQKNSLGRALIKDRFGKTSRATNNGLLHTADLDDGYDWNKINLKSVTEESSFQEFLSTAELAGTEFTAEKLNISFVNPKSQVGLLSKEEFETVSKNMREKKKILKIPRRPKWDKNTSAEQLQEMERDDFLKWRRELNLLQEEDGMILTPYEKNLDFWRQLWRVIERSDVILQIVDARNPLLFRCEDLEKYVKEVSPHKRNMILLNKADFLTLKQRRYWVKYFDSVGIPVACFSATQTFDNIEEENVNINDDIEEDLEEEEDDELEWEDVSDEEQIETPVKEDYKVESSPKLLNREELITLFKSLYDVNIPRVHSGVITMGLVGYPNVGKSSTINAILSVKKVSVSATPGKTKHFQTLFVDDELLLCDCPGLVMPSFLFSKADMILNGILPINEMRDHVPAINLLCTLIPRDVLSNTYGIMIPSPPEGEDPNRPPYAEELLNSYAYTRGYMTQHGQPDNARASRYVLKDFVNGHLLYCHAPPGVSQEKFHTFKLKDRKYAQPTPKEAKFLGINTSKSSELDGKFFTRAAGTPMVKGRSSIIPPNVIGKNNLHNSNMSINSISSNDPKPWKNHKDKRNKKDKQRHKPVSYF